MENYQAIQVIANKNLQMDENDDIQVLGEIPKSYTVSVIKHGSSTLSQASPKNGFSHKTALNQFHQTKILNNPAINPDQSRLIIDLRKKLLLEKLKVAEATRRIKQQESQITSLEHENSNLTSVIASTTVKTLEDEENVSKLLFFLKHFNNEFDFVIEKMKNSERNHFTSDDANNQIENISSTTDIPVAYDVESQLKYMSLDLVTKLEKMVGIHSERRRDLEETKKKLVEIEKQAQYSISMAIAAQTWMPPPVPVEKNSFSFFPGDSGTKVCFKRARYECNPMTYGNFTNWEILQESIKRKQNMKRKEGKNKTANNGIHFNN